LKKQKINHDDFLEALDDLRKIKPENGANIYRIAAETFNKILDHGQWFENYIKTMRGIQKKGQNFSGRKKQSLETISAYAMLRRDYRKLKKDDKYLEWKEFMQLPETQKYINGRSTYQLNIDRAI